MNKRLERILLQLAREHAPELIPPGWDSKLAYENRLRHLAGGLADRNLLVIMGLVPDALRLNRAEHIQAWISNYGRFYMLLAGKLFPSFAHVEAFYADPHTPPITVFNGASRPVMAAMSGLVLPFIAKRQKELVVSVPELLGLMSIVLDDLEAGSLPHAEYNRLRDKGMEALRDILAHPIRQLALTRFDRALFLRNKPPETLPEERPRDTGLLPLLPEEEEADTTPTEELFTRPIPMVFQPPGSNNRRRPRPPVRHPPGDEGSWL